VAWRFTKQNNVKLSSFLQRRVKISGGYIDKILSFQNSRSRQEILTYVWQVSEYVFLSQNLSGFRESGHTFLENTAKKQIPHFL
jgi:hypothetical protein